MICQRHSFMMPKLPLQSYHEAHGARLVPLHEGLLPASYGDSLMEYRSVRDRVGVVDLSHDSMYLFSGDDRTDFLQNVMSNDIHQARLDRGIKTALLTAKGKMLSVLAVYPITNAYLLEMESVIAETTVQHLMRYKLRSKIKLEEMSWGKLLISGPKALSLLDVLGWPTRGAEEGAFIYQETDPVFCVRTHQTSEDDYTIYFKRDNMEYFLTALLTSGEQFGVALVGQTALDMLRIEAGRPRYGIDMDDTTFPIEAGLEESVISYTKGCYPGQEVMARIKTYGHVNRHLAGLILKGTDIPERKASVWEAGEGGLEMGWVTSAVYSPRLDAPIAMAYLQTAKASPGSPVAVSVSGGRVEAVVTTLPFYERRG